MDTFVARQPIFDRAQHVVAYELLFRSGAENYFHDADQDDASRRVINASVHTFRRGELTGGRKAFINISRAVLLDGFPFLLPSDTTVLELLETIEPDEEVITACRALKQAGYTLALDDFVFKPGFEELMPYVDIIKIDVRQTARDESEALMRTWRRRGVEFLAEKVETKQEFLEHRKLGYEYFQGYFVCRPEMLTRKGISAARRSVLDLIKEINRPDLDLTGLERTIQRDSGLTLKLLRYLNSAHFSLSTRVTSVMHALRLLGDRPMRTWATLIALSALGEGKPGELVTTGLIRGRFCETAGVTSHAPFPTNELFLLGILSTFDALLDMRIEDVLAEMSVADELSSALSGGGGPLGALYGLTRALERGEWDKASIFGRQAGIDDADVARLYRDAVIWSDRVMAG